MYRGPCVCQHLYFTVLKRIKLPRFLLSNVLSHLCIHRNVLSKSSCSVFPKQFALCRKETVTPANTSFEDCCVNDKQKRPHDRALRDTVYNLAVIRQKIAETLTQKCCHTETVRSSLCRSWVKLRRRACVEVFQVASHQKPFQNPSRRFLVKHTDHAILSLQQTKHEVRGIHPLSHQLWYSRNKHDVVLYMRKGIK